MHFLSLSLSFMVVRRFCRIYSSVQYSLWIKIIGRRIWTVRTVCLTINNLWLWASVLQGAYQVTLSYWKEKKSKFLFCQLVREVSSISGIPYSVAGLSWPTVISKCANRINYNCVSVLNSFKKLIAKHNKIIIKAT